MSEISLCMIVKDERGNLERLLPHLAPYVAEMLIADTGSTDGTQSFLTSYPGVRLFRASLVKGFAIARNVCIEAATREWILWVDADEWPTKELLRWMHWFVGTKEATDCDSVYIWRENRVDGNLIGAKSYERHIRLFRRHLRVEGVLHEQVFSKNGAAPTAPRDFLLLHHKTRERQDKQDAFYAQFVEKHGLRL